MVFPGNSTYDCEINEEEERKNIGNNNNNKTMNWRGQQKLFIFLYGARYFISHVPFCILFSPVFNLIFENYNFLPKLLVKI